MSHTQEVMRYFHAMGQAGVRFQLAQTVLNNAQVLQRLAVAECNRELTEYERKKIDRAAARIVEAAAESGGKFKPAEIGGDPRGYVVKLHLAGGAHNTMGGAGSGYGVPAKG